MLYLLFMIHRIHFFITVTSSCATEVSRQTFQRYLKMIQPCDIACGSARYLLLLSNFGWIKQETSIKIEQCDVTCFIISLFNAQHVSNVSTSILRILRLICCVISWVVLLWFDMCWCYGVVRLGWCGILMQAEAKLQPA